MTVLKRSGMMLFSHDNIHGHRVRVVLAEKAVTVEIVLLEKETISETLLELNPAHTVPTLVDRELVLYTPSIIMEYLDERFPHPPLSPGYPVARAKFRLMMYRMEQDIYTLADSILLDETSEAEKETARTQLRDLLVKLSPIFDDMPYMLSQEFTLVDCSLLPVLWRLKKLGITLPPRAKPLRQYADRLFEKDGFQASLTDTEQEF